MKKILVLAICFLCMTSVFAFSRTSRENIRLKSKKDHLNKIKQQGATIKDLHAQIRTQRVEIKLLKYICRKENYDIESLLQQDISDKFKNPLHVGQVAFIDGSSLKVEHIMDGQNIIAELIFGYRRTIDRAAARNARFLTSVPYTGPSIPISTLVWIKGIDTSNLTSRKYVRDDILYKITGTKTYPVVSGGTNTVFVLEPYELNALK